MKALSLFGVFVLAKILILAGREVPSSWWTPVAYLWQDVAVALVLGAVEFLTRRRPPVSWILYGAVVLYVAVNVPLTRILSSPLTWQMSQAAGGALSDSIAHYITLQNTGLILAILVTGMLLPRCLKNVSRRAALVLASLGFVLAGLGPIASGRVETLGVHRNAVVAMIDSTLPRVTANDLDRDWRASPFATHPGANLGHLRGMAAGRNVILILLESTGAGYLRPYGGEHDPMPHLSRLAEASLLFDHAYAVYPESIKGLFSVLCSRYPAFDTRAADYERVLTPSLARVLGEGGYRTGLFHSGRFMYLGMNSIIQNRGYDVLEDAGAISGNFNSSFGVDEPATVTRMLAWLDSIPRGQRFFLTYLPIAGHHPYNTPHPGPFPVTTEREQYLNALHDGDRALGELFQGLKGRGLDTNTLFVIFGDHGEAFGQHEGNYGHTLFIHEENVRVPYLIAAPGLIREQVRVPRVASLIDTAPTILDLLGLPAPEDYQGRSLLEDENQMALFYTDYSLGLLGLRDGRWKFTFELESNRPKLFDLARDPAEQNNLAGSYPKHIRFYREHLLNWSGAQKHLLTQRFPRS